MPERTDLDIPEGTVWPASDEPSEATGDDQDPGAAPPVSLDPDRDTAERNAASGGWDGANEQIENDFEAEQLRRAQPAKTDEDGPLA